MLRVVIAFVSLSVFTDASFTDMNCTNGDTTTTKFIASSTACSDIYAPSTCLALFGAAVVAGSTTDRDVKCNTDANGISEDVKQLAISVCPKHCGYCCNTPEYQCSNKLFPRTNCATVTVAQCSDATWRPILAEDCPNVCGFCLTGGCVDKVIQCANDINICRQVDMQTFVKENCQRTCGYCPTSTTAASAAAVTVATTAKSASATAICTSAVDSNANCATWYKNGFCTNTFYTLAQRKQYCAKTCNLC
ncbi:hypothetical protein RB195_003201 [Necator americanus]|uniref:ShKT domain-containing protein n=1 Tax=Necator americanus TaxID=51031 RepID=A0ABR1DN21_NECAM